MTARRRLAGQGVWAIADQALFALASFALNLLLARQLGPAEYGVFGVAFTVFLLASMAYTTLVLEPLLVFGAGRWRPAFRAYLRQALGVMVAVAGAGAVLLTIASLVVGLLAYTAPLAPLLRTLAWATPCIVLQWTMRRASYVHGRPDIAASGGLVYLVVLFGVVALMQATVGLDARLAFVAMAASSVLVALFLAWRLLGMFPADAEVGADERPVAASVWREHWRFGRWALAAALIGWLASDVFYLVLAPQHGFAAVGEVRAAYNLVLPILHVLTALSTVALPWFAAARASGALRRPILTFWGGVAALAIGYGIALALAADVLVRVVYGESFGGIRPLVMVLALLPLATATSAALATVLRSLERSRDVFVAASIAAAGGVGLGIPVTTAFGAIGAVAAIVSSAAIYSLATLWRVRRAGILRRDALTVPERSAEADAGSEAPRD